MLINSKARAELVLRSLGDYGQLTYDEGLLLLNDTEGFLSSMTPYDPAYAHFTDQRCKLYRLLEALNFVHDLNREDHINAYTVLFTTRSDDKNTDTVTIKLPRLYSQGSPGFNSKARDYINDLIVKGLTKFKSSDTVNEILILD